MIPTPNHPTKCFWKSLRAKHLNYLSCYNPGGYEKYLKYDDSMVITQH